MIDLSVYISLFIISVVLFHVFYKSNRLKKLFFAKLYKRDESSHGFIFKDANFGIFSVDFFFADGEVLITFALTYPHGWKVCIPYIDRRAMLMLIN